MQLNPVLDHVVLVRQVAVAGQGYGYLAPHQLFFRGQIEFLDRVLDATVFARAIGEELCVLDQTRRHCLPIFKH